MANAEGLNLRVRPWLREGGYGRYGVGDYEDEDDDLSASVSFRRWRWRLRIRAFKNKLKWSYTFRILFFFLLVAAIFIAFPSLHVEKRLKNFLIWIKQDLGPWGPLVLTLAYIPLTVLAVPASVLTLGGGYLFGLAVGFVADSIGATLGATAAFLIGRTIGRSYVISKLKYYPKFQAVAIAIKRSGFKITLLLRLVPLLPFNMLNYLLSITPVSLGEYMLASWLGMMPITFALVYTGTSLKDLSEITHGWNEISMTRWVYILMGFGVSVILIVCVTRIAKASLDKAIEENVELESSLAQSMLPISSNEEGDWQKPLIISIDPLRDDQEFHKK